MFLTLYKKLQVAQQNIENGEVDVDNVELETYGENVFRNPTELLNWLQKNCPNENICIIAWRLLLTKYFCKGYARIVKNGVCSFLNILCYPANNFPTKQ